MSNVIKFKEFMNEVSSSPGIDKTIIQNDMNLLNNIEAKFKKYFPNGWIRTQAGKRGSFSAMGFEFGVVDPSEHTSGIDRNDPVYHNFIIKPLHGTDYEIKDLIGSISINPENKAFAMGSVKTKFRKSKGNVSKLTKTMDTFFKRLKALVKENESNIYQRDNYSDKYFK